MTNGDFILMLIFASLAALFLGQINKIQESEITKLETRVLALEAK